jgi:hypothetical protein
MVTGRVLAMIFLETLFRSAQTSGQSSEQVECPWIDALMEVDEFRNRAEETDAVLIPCEYCGTQIPLSDWSRHTVNSPVDLKRELLLL